MYDKKPERHCLPICLLLLSLSVAAQPYQVVVAVDGSDASSTALLWVVEHLLRQGDVLHLISVASRAPVSRSVSWSVNGSLALHCAHIGAYFCKLASWSCVVYVVSLHGPFCGAFVQNLLSWLWAGGWAGGRVRSAVARSSLHLSRSVSLSLPLSLSHSLSISRSLDLSISRSLDLSMLISLTIYRGG